MPRRVGRCPTRKPGTWRLLFLCLPSVVAGASVEKVAFRHSRLVPAGLVGPAMECLKSRTNVARKPTPCLCRSGSTNPEAYHNLFRLHPAILGQPLYRGHPEFEPIRSRRACGGIRWNRPGGSQGPWRRIDDRRLQRADVRLPNSVVSPLPPGGRNRAGVVGRVRLYVGGSDPPLTACVFRPVAYLFRRFSPAREIGAFVARQAVRFGPALQAR